ncbi:MAG TPA: galactose-1-phosphate uridylyltransferase [Myxococcales bacterium]|jgi:UDPglucose--hexose-1-phosphate uridylyltransferase|nr:galactose-1-phosphate uridylyltransferase [Myxococcales bacterium]
MPELRKDPVVDRWVIIAPERADRPQAWLRRGGEDGDDAAGCPFCPGNEAMTPPELYALRDGPAWSVRVVPNRYPALRTEIQLSREGRGSFDRMSGTGAHEVIIETPQHGVSLGQLPAKQVSAVLSAWQVRMRDLARDERLRCALLFKNEGLAAGATLSHAHSQLMALPLVPAELTEEMSAARDHFGRKERCIYCDVIAQELLEKERVIHEGERFVSLAPFASRSPFETLILPRAHQSGFEQADALELAACAEELRTLLRKIEVALERPALTLFLHTAPLREAELPWYHWHLTVKPTVAGVGGFEWGSGCFINPTPPEEAARFLRQTEV